MPIYTTAPSQMPLVAEPPTTQYLPSFSPPIPDHGQAGMFQGHYPPPSYMQDYGYSSTAGPSMPSPYGYVQPSRHDDCPRLFLLTGSQ